MLALDLDGTVLNDREHLVPGIVQEVEAWHQLGWNVAVITARWRKLPLMAHLKPDAHTRSYGAQVFVQGMELARLSIDPGEVKQALEVVPPGARLRVMTANYCFCADPSHPLDRHLDTLTEQHEVLKILVQHPDPALLSQMAVLWEELPFTAQIWERATACSLVAEGADKGSALRRIASNFGLTLERTLAVGDGHADTAMLACAGAFLRVGNNPALNAANYHAASPEDLPDQLAQLRQTVYR